ncbi:tRNA pseudouridine synthase [Tuber magnatum]|uniref:tRNA pseudouridine synthase 1 n=1 Tax=Tuber magnatum TaxID=42249 RepID=A0A317SGY9_9PEZI|nr:tRNA pseudouridine synthase [Tuber magnatum]
MTDINDSSKASLLLPDPSPATDSPTGDQTVPSGSNSRGAKDSRARRYNSRGRGGSSSSCSKRKKQDQGRTAYKRNRDSKWEPRNAEERRPKKKVAVLIGYCGTGYRGMQLNPPHKSIEGDLFEAFVQAGAISRSNSDDPKKSSLVRCARTDKGVHAAGNAISLKLIIEDPDIIQKINSHLPAQIRVWGIVRTVGSFSSYQQCDSRRYEYLVPSHCFLPPHPKSYLAKKKTYRISPERLQKVREGFKSYEGTHNFHNFTIQRTFKDPSSKRFIKSFEVLDPIIINNTEWLSLRVHGQSFMMHQIRELPQDEMVGMVIMVVRTGCPLERIKEAYGPRVVPIPKAPSLGLLLESPVFDAYNRKAERDFLKEPIDFSKYAKEIGAFRDKMIYTKLFEEEERAHVYTQFVHFIDSFRSPLFHYLTSAGLKALDEVGKEQGVRAMDLQLLPDNESEDEDTAVKSAEAG